MSKRLNMDSNDTIDHKWSRQIKIYGIEITTILSKLKILIIDLRGYGVEIAKNNYFIKSKSSIFF